MRLFSAKRTSRSRKSPERAPVTANAVFHRLTQSDMLEETVRRKQEEDTKKRRGAVKAGLAINVTSKKNSKRRGTLFADFTAENVAARQRLKSGRFSNEGEMRRVRSDLMRNKRFFRQTDVNQKSADDMCSLRCHHNSILRLSDSIRPSEGHATRELRRLQSIMRPHTTGHGFAQRDQGSWWDGTESCASASSWSEFPDSGSDTAEDLMPVRDFLMWIVENCDGSLKKAFGFLDAFDKGKLARKEFIASLNRGNFCGDKDALFNILDDKRRGIITVEEFHNLAPYFNQILQEVERARKKLSDKQSMEEPVTDIRETPASSPINISRTCTIWLFRNGDPKHQGERLLLKHPPRNLAHLYEIVQNVCPSRPGKVVGLYNVSLQRVKSPYELAQNGKYIVHGGEKLEPPSTFWDFVPQGGGPRLQDAQRSILRTASCPTIPRLSGLSLSLPHLS